MLSLIYFQREQSDLKNALRTGIVSGKYLIEIQQHVFKKCPLLFTKCIPIRKI